MGNHHAEGSGSRRRPWWAVGLIALAGAIAALVGTGVLRLGKSGDSPQSAEHAAQQRCQAEVVKDWCRRTKPRSLNCIRRQALSIPTAGISPRSTPTRTSRRRHLPDHCAHAAWPGWSMRRAKSVPRSRPLRLPRLLRRRQPGPHPGGLRPRALKCPGVASTRRGSHDEHWTTHDRRGQCRCGRAGRLRPQQPTAPSASPRSGSVWVADEGHDSITVIDASTTTTAMTLNGIRVPQHP